MTETIPKHLPTLAIHATAPELDYELLDSGEGEKLERYGDIVLSRPDPQALWRKTLPVERWAAAHARFVRSSNSAHWTFEAGTPDRWNISFAGLRFLIKPSAFKHTGLFPEQKNNWDFIARSVRSAKRPVRVLNLFGYTGGATLAAAQAGAEVVHVDGSKSAIGWARENAKLSGLEAAPIRWLLDDARAFLIREKKRGNHYDGIVMDPPAFGHGPNKELWKIEEHLLPLLDLVRATLSEKPIFVIINGYASGYSSLAYERNLQDLMRGFGGTFESGELAIEESATGRLLPAGIFARWRA